MAANCLAFFMVRLDYSDGYSNYGTPLSSHISRFVGQRPRSAPWLVQQVRELQQ